MPNKKNDLMRYILHDNDELFRVTSIEINPFCNDNGYGLHAQQYMLMLIC